MAVIMHFFLTFTILCILQLSTTIVGHLSLQKQKPIITPLIHHKSRKSPHYHPNLSIYELAARDWEISLQRIHSLIGKTHAKESFSTDDEPIQTVVFADKSSIPLFQVLLKMGKPPQYQAVALDTGSKLFWVKCAPYFEDDISRNDYVNYDIYERQVSLTYSEEITCDQYCVDLNCPNDDCNFEVKYMSNHYTRGGLASETIIFDAPWSNPTTLDNIVFGCATETNINNINGILGLSFGNVSIVSQLALTEFSYCLGNLSAPEEETNALILRKNFNVIGLSTPLIIERTHYYVELQGISFSGRRLRIDRQGLKRTAGSGGALFDSGTATTVLQGIAYSELERAILNFIGDDLSMIILTRPDRRICFHGNLYRDFNYFPIVTFHFVGGARMELNKENIFIQMGDELVCLSILPAGQLGISYSIIGINVQQYFYIAFDLEKKMLSFERIGCEFLQDENDDGDD